MDRKRLQVFVSSTYDDLRDERRAAMETVLEAGHFPAGMEQFAAGDQSQMDVIHRWIKLSDVFMLILGGRYGSIEPTSQMSYTQLEYEYALEQKIPIFAVVITDTHLEQKVRSAGSNVIERENPQKLRHFRETVTKNRMVAFWSDIRDIKHEVYKALRELADREDLVGWQRADEIEAARAQASSQVAALVNEISALRQTIKILAEQRDAAISENSIALAESGKLLAEEALDLEPQILHSAFQLSIDNVTRYGDTDVFPFPVENILFFDNPAESVQLLEALHLQSTQEFHGSLDSFLHEEGLTAVGYNGFRWATQMDPFWNAYLLGLVIAIGNEIESERVPVTRNVVFSYRFKPDLETKTIFDRTIGWPQFQQTSIEVARQYRYVIICDIADYYMHIGHLHLDNALKRAAPGNRAANRIMALLRAWSKGVGYGLPVGGPAARLLSELLLNDIDNLLLSAEITFCRFVDDYRVFARTEKEARSHLAFLSELLAKTSLPLQKAKTRILSSEEFRSYYDPGSPEDEAEALDRQVLTLRLHFDPYSPTANDDYETLTTEMSKYPVGEMLARQIRKSRIDQAVTKKLIQMVKFQKPGARDRIVASLLDNLESLYPVFPTVMIVLKGVLPDLEERVQLRVFRLLRQMINDDPNVSRVSANQAFAVRVLAYDKSNKTAQILMNLYRTTDSMMLKRDIILGMARNGLIDWITARLRDFRRATPWERRALLLASYTVGAVGEDFRRLFSGELKPAERLVSQWAAARFNRGNLEIPL
jgi:Domain of unknown function (DUF4062)/Reverse transcriptase (RNA-dependent DNA polymerase)